MTYDDLIKEAGIFDTGSELVSGILEQVKGMVDFKNKPFETILGILGTGLSFKFGIIIGMLTTAAELTGYGPGYIGRLIDKHLFKGKALEDVKLSQSDITGAADATADDIIKDFSSFPEKLESQIKSSFNLNLNDLKEIKGNISKDDIRTAFYVSMYNPIIKTAGITATLWRNFANFFRGAKETGKGIFSGVIMKLIFTFVKGMGALAVGGGAASLLGVRTKQQKQFDKETGTVKETNKYLPQRPPGLKHYSNVNKDVKRTLITFLNAEIANFETGFMQAQRLANPSITPVSLELAPGWAIVLGLVQKYNWAPIPEVNNFSAFVAPGVQKVAQILLQSSKINGVKIEKIDSIKPEERKSPTNEDRLGQLLQGANK